MLPSGTRLGAYEVRSALGAGGMGEVYRARDTAMWPSKSCPSASSPIPSTWRFEREAQILAALRSLVVVQHWTSELQRLVPAR